MLCSLTYAGISNINYDLETIEQGELMIGFNNKTSITSYSMIASASKIINKGSGTHTFLVDAMTKDWLTAGSFNVYVNLSPYPHLESWTPLDTDLHAINFE